MRDLVDTRKRCFGGQLGQELYAAYHDEEWGRPSRDERYLFEMLCLEGAQAGLNWYTVLKKREGYRRLFHHFDPEKVAGMSDHELEGLCHNSEVIRNRLKIFSARQNGRVFVTIQQEFGSFADYLWGYVEGVPIVNSWKSLNEVPCKTAKSDQIARDLKRRGMNFVGSTIVYAYMQAVGLVDDHLVDCWCRSQ